MKRKRLSMQLFPSYVILSLLAVLAVTWYSGRSLREFYRSETRTDLEARAKIMAAYVGASGLAPESAVLDPLCKQLGRTTGMRLTIIGTNGVVLGDTDNDPARMENHFARPEFHEALMGRTGQAERFSDTERELMLYCAVPVSPEHGAPALAVRAAMSLGAVEAHVGKVAGEVSAAGVVTIFISALVAWVVSRRISRPIEEMKRGAGHFVSGDLEYRLALPDTGELAGLAEVMNQMASQLDERIHAIVRERNEREAAFSSMVEGVIAVDHEERITSINRAAAQLVGVAPENAIGRRVGEVVRNFDVQVLIARARASSQPEEADIVLDGDGERYLQAHGTMLVGDAGREPGALIVLNDVTRLKKLENMRRDFVANVSHELKTPITSIKGAVETLLGGAVNEPAGARRFLEIIERHGVRLETLVEDLLTLSRIEYESERNQIALDRQSLNGILQSALQACNERAAARQVKLSLSAPESILSCVNAPLMEQAVINLIDNATKYSAEGGEVSVQAFRQEGEVVVQVKDTGVGIESRHLSRLFERFYRVDMARSRKMGGTGLGLAIVKHVVLAHKGRVTVESTPGKGSVFSIHLPA